MLRKTATQNEQNKTKQKVNQTRTTQVLSQPNQQKTGGWVGVSPNVQCVSLEVYASQMKALSAKKGGRIEVSPNVECFRGTRHQIIVAVGGVDICAGKMQCVKRNIHKMSKTK